MLVQIEEARIILAIEAIRTSRKKLSRRKAAKYTMSMKLHFAIE